jgi:hypothetical protein
MEDYRRARRWRREGVPLDEPLEKPSSVLAPRCECGNSKSPHAEACDRCLHLDSPVKSIAFAIISALRASDGGLTLVELIAEIGGKRNSVEVALLKLVRRGRRWSIDTQTLHHWAVTP